MRVTTRQATLALLLLGAVDCNVYGGQTAPTVLVEGVVVVPQTIQFTAVGKTQQVVARIAPSNATDMEVTWETSNPAVATVNTTGLVTATGIGDGVFITVHTRDGNHQASVNVSVLP